MSNIVLARLGENIKASTAGQVAASSGPSTAPTLVDNTFSFRNKIINGNFDIWQRGTSLSSESQTRYLADRWKTGGAFTFVAPSRQELTVQEQSLISNGAQFFHRCVVTAQPPQASGNFLNYNYMVVQQPIENVRTLAGKTATLSFWAKADSAKPIAVSIVQIYSSPNIGQYIQTNNFNLTTTWQKITMTVNNIPTLPAGQFINNYSGLWVSIWLNSEQFWRNQIGHNVPNQSGTFDIAQVQLEEGLVATPFEQRPIGTELALCQRYFQYYELFSQSGFVQSYPHNMRDEPVVTRVSNHPTTGATAPNNINSYPRNISVGNNLSSTPWGGVFSLDSEF
jgi:hypothetical protein